MMDKKLHRVFFSSSTPLSKNDNSFKEFFIGGVDPINGNSMQIFKANYSNIWYTETGRKRFKNMSTQDLNGNELVIGDRILICTEKDYGWLGYAHIIGESKLTWRIKLEDSNTYNQTRNFDKNPKRIIKC